MHKKPDLRDNQEIIEEQTEGRTRKAKRRRSQTKQEKHHEHKSHEDPQASAAVKFHPRVKSRADKNPKLERQKSNEGTPHQEMDT